jgi:hypothetical protein
VDSRRPEENHGCVMKDAVNEIAARLEAGVVDIFNVISLNRITSLVSALPVAASFVVATIRQEFMANAAVGGNPLSDNGNGRPFQSPFPFLRLGLPLRPIRSRPVGYPRGNPARND